MSDAAITIFHNPNCGTSRNVVALVEAAGYTPNIVQYLKTGWTIEQLRDLAERTGVGVRGLLRERGTPAAELGLLEPDVSDDAILAAMVAEPILVERPIVVTPWAAALCRPKEKVQDLLERRPGATV